MFKILLFPLYLLYYLLLNIGGILDLFETLIRNIFERKCKKDVNDIVAISYYEDLLIQNTDFALYYDKKLLPENWKDNKNDTKISKKIFDELLESIKQNKLLKKKTRRLKWPFISPFEYYEALTCTDVGDPFLDLTFYFKDGSKKSVYGYSSASERFKDKLGEVLPKDIL